MEEGREQGREEGILGTIKICVDIGMDFEEITRHLIDTYNLNIQQVHTYFKNYKERYS